MQIYLPIAELSVNMFIIFGMGGAVGFLSGLFGVGGGFLLTPLLIFSGIPPVGRGRHRRAARSSPRPPPARSSYWRRSMIDMKLATVLVLSRHRRPGIGVVVFDALRAARPARPHHLARLRHLPRPRSAG